MMKRSFAVGLCLSLLAGCEEAPAERTTELIAPVPTPTPTPDPARAAAATSSTATATSADRGDITVECFQPPPYELSELRLIGIIKSADVARALVRGPKGEDYEIGVGSPLGLKFGRVKNITERCLEGTSEWRDKNTGEKIIEPFSLCLE